MKKLVLIFGSMLLIAGSATAGFFLYQYQYKSATPVPVQVSGLPPQPDPFSKQATMIGMQRPEFSLNDVDGELRNISDWDGQVIALNFWATWCPPCLKEIPEFIHLQDKYSDAGLQFIGIALERAEDARVFMLKQGVNYPVLAGEMEVIKIAQTYGNIVGALPYTVIIDRKGKIVFIKPGQLAGETAEDIIRPLL